ncbi:hypothetical protein [Tateyamaria sp.]|uniref:hypothetical protein n=1 Tax=Tateyamaria sp. TaxID=1929288 RepID=UPI00329A9051
MNNMHVGLIIAAIGLATVAIIYVPEFQKKQQLERDRSGTCILYRTTVQLAQLYLDNGNEEKTKETLGKARDFLEKGSCTNIL